jgi:hypothetical protein
MGLFRLFSCSRARDMLGDAHVLVQIQPPYGERNRMVFVSSLALRHMLHHWFRGDRIFRLPFLRSRGHCDGPCTASDATLTATSLPAEPPPEPSLESTGVLTESRRTAHVLATAQPNDRFLSGF